MHLSETTLVFFIAVLYVENGFGIPLQFDERGITRPSTHLAARKSLTEGVVAVSRRAATKAAAKLSKSSSSTKKTPNPKTNTGNRVTKSSTSKSGAGSGSTSKSSSGSKGKSGGGVSAGDLKTSNYRKTAMDNNKKGSYVQSANGKSVKWDKKGKGDAEHVVEPGQHVKPVMNKLGISKKDPLFKDAKAALNHKDNLSMLDNKSNIAKAKLAGNPKANPKSGDAAKDYMKKPDVQDKASKTLGKLVDAGNKHGQPAFGQGVSKLVKQNFPNARSLEEVDELEIRSLNSWISDELD